jgi:quercetin dioxygenase-like cupin family protein
MIDAALERWTSQKMEARIVRYADLRPCFNAFVDTRSPGSEAKENFTIIGPGVSENPEQHVHIAEPHGFNIGGARQPPGCVNSQHSHDTAEVFVVHSGRWRFDLGEHGEDAKVELRPGDVVSLPTRMFRGFTNVGDDSGFLWAVLGGDDPGRVTWAPAVFDLARDHGLILLESGKLIDTTRGQSPGPDERPMARTSPEQVSALRRMTPADAERIVVRPGDGAHGETALIGEDAPLGGGHGFTLSRLDLEAGEAVERTRRDGVEVLFVQFGTLEFSWGEGQAVLGAGDTLTVPTGLPRNFRAGAEGAAVFVVRDGDRVPELYAG